MTIYFIMYITNNIHHIGALMFTDKGHITVDLCRDDSNLFLSLCQALTDLNPIAFIITVCLCAHSSVCVVFDLFQQ